VAAFLPATLHAPVLLKPLDNTGSVAFVIENLGFDVKGSFAGLEGSLEYDENTPSASKFNVSVQASTVNTSNKTRDKHLRGEDYFHVTQHPLIKISSSKIAKSVTPGYLVFFGQLSMRGVTKDISFPFKAVAENDGYRFTGSFKIKRRDFGVGGRSTVSNDVDIKLNVLAKKL
jgi:polyisoprenoid-binding protein YceI